MANISLIENVLKQNYSNSKGALECNISESQYKRYKKRYLIHGNDGLKHGGIGNKNACKYSDEQKEHLVATYKSEALIIEKQSNGLRGARKLKVFASSYTIKNNFDIPYTTVKKILNDAGIESPKCRFENIHHKNIALANSSPWFPAGTEYQADGSMGYKFPDDDFEVAAHVIVEATTSTLVGLHFEKGENNKGYEEAFMYSFKNFGIPLKVSTDGRTSFFNARQNEKDTFIGATLRRLDIELKTTRNCNRNNKVENAHDPVRDYIWEQMLLDGIRTFEEANKKLNQYVNWYNKALDHSIPLDNLLRQLDFNEIEEKFAKYEIRSMSNKFTIQRNKKQYFLVNNNRILQKRKKTKIKLVEPYQGEIYCTYGGNKYLLVEATKENLKKLEFIDGKIEEAIVKKNGYNFRYEQKDYHAIDSLGRPVELKHRDTVKLSIINGEIRKVRTNKGTYKVVEKAISNNIYDSKIISRKVSYKRTIQHGNSEYILLDKNGDRFICDKGKDVSLIIINDTITCVNCEGNTYLLLDLKDNNGRFKIPTSEYAANQMFK